MDLEKKRGENLSISLEDARKKLDILEQLSNAPQLILTNLLSDGLLGTNFLYQVNINGKYIMDYLREYLCSIDPFKDCIIKNNSYIFSFYLPSLKVGNHSEFNGYDLIAQINAYEKTFKLFTECIDDYNDVMSQEYQLEIVELSNWWKRFTDLRIKNRISQIREVIHSDKKLFVKIADIYFWIVMTNRQRRKIQEALERENEKVSSSNKYNKEKYEENIEKQDYYKQYAPGQIRRIRNKQKEIEDFLKDIGYIEDIGMSKY